MTDRFRDDFPEGPHLIDGQLLNRQHRVLNELGEHAYDGSSRDGYTVIAPAPLVVGILQVTDAANTCQPEANEVQPPCSSRNLYLARWRYWDSEAQEWKEYDEDIRLDAAAIGGTRQSLWSGEILPAVYDAHRNMAVPVGLPPNYVGALIGNLLASNGTIATSTTASLKRRNTATGQLSAVTDNNNQPVVVRVYSFYAQIVPANQMVVINRDGFGDFWVLSPECWIPA